MGVIIGMHKYGITLPSVLMVWCCEGSRESCAPGVGGNVWEPQRRTVSAADAVFTSSGFIGTMSPSDLERARRKGAGGTRLDMPRGVPGVLLKDMAGALNVSFFLMVLSITLPKNVSAHRATVNQAATVIATGVMVPDIRMTLRHARSLHHGAAETRIPIIMTAAKMRTARSATTTTETAHKKDTAITASTDITNIIAIERRMSL